MNWVQMAAAAVTGVFALQGAPGPAVPSDGPRPVAAHSQTRAVPVAPGRRDAAVRLSATRPFSLLGVTWDDPRARLTGTAEFRTRSAVSGQWSGWSALDADDGPGDASARRGGTSAVWAGPSDGAEVRIVVDSDTTAVLPTGLRLDLIDPGGGTPVTPGTPGTSVTPGTPSTPSTPGTSVTPAAGSPAQPADGGTGTLGAVRPAITSRAGWGADESISPAAPQYLPGGKVKAVVVHHTAGSNAYACADAPAVVRGIYAYHVQQLGWRDIGYNFLVDKCGTLYEGRKGGVDRPVLGAHAYGFNTETSGIAVLGTFTTAAPGEAVTSAVARLAAWKLGLYGVSPTGTTTLTAGADGTNYFGKAWTLGTRLSMPTIHGHRDGYNTQCPGDALYAELTRIRTLAAQAAG
ncbi:N-acetylmuramoyl-L-alanine amidase [Streptomyces longwoodensis]|uniref:N-acetylmuramoyl-L-alanine amidase n=1 Tax=Streptomyces longwoodensis TaxID=68231 RepID=UPI0033E2FE72